MAFSPWPLAALAVALFMATEAPAADSPSSDLKVILIRHGEKPATGENLSCKGLNRALQIPAMLERRFGIPRYAYVPALKTGSSTKHARMFETVAPLAIRENLRVNSHFEEADVATAAKELLSLNGTVLVVWEHSQLASMVKALGVPNPPLWADEDFDAMWIVTFSGGKASMSIDKENLAPAPECAF